MVLKAGSQEVHQNAISRPFLAKSSESLSLEKFRFLVWWKWLRHHQLRLLLKCLDVEKWCSCLGVQSLNAEKNL